MCHRSQQELEKKMQTPGYTPGKRQYLHKMRMLEMNRNRQEVSMRRGKSVVFTTFTPHNHCPDLEWFSIHPQALLSTVNLVIVTEAPTSELGSLSRIPSATDPVEPFLCFQSQGWICVPRLSVFSFFPFFFLHKLLAWHSGSSRKMRLDHLSWFRKTERGESVFIFIPRHLP